MLLLFSHRLQELGQLQEQNWHEKVVYLFLKMNCQNTFLNGQPELFFISSAADNGSLMWLANCYLKVPFFNQYPRKTR